MEPGLSLGRTHYHRLLSSSSESLCYGHHLVAEFFLFTHLGGRRVLGDVRELEGNREGVGGVLRAWHRRRHVSSPKLARTTATQYAKYAASAAQSNSLSVRGEAEGPERFERREGNVDDDGFNTVDRALPCSDVAELRGALELNLVGSSVTLVLGAELVGKRARGFGSCGCPKRRSSKLCLVSLVARTVTNSTRAAWAWGRCTSIWSKWTT